MLNSPCLSFYSSGVSRFAVGLKFFHQVLPRSDFSQSDSFPAHPSVWSWRWCWCSSSCPGWTCLMCGRLHLIWSVCGFDLCILHNECFCVHAFIVEVFGCRGLCCCFVMPPFFFVGVYCVCGFGFVMLLFHQLLLVCSSLLVFIGVTSTLLLLVSSSPQA